MADETKADDIGTRPVLNATMRQHELWLRQFASLMEYQSTGQGQNLQMTPFRSGVVTRLRWAADNIAALEKAVAGLEKQLSFERGERKRPN
jgi:hypothetical protein